MSDNRKMSDASKRIRIKMLEQQIRTIEDAKGDARNKRKELDEINGANENEVKFKSLSDEIMIKKILGRDSGEAEGRRDRILEQMEQNQNDDMQHRNRHHKEEKRTGPRSEIDNSPEGDTILSPVGTDHLPTQPAPSRPDVQSLVSAIQEPGDPVTRIMRQKPSLWTVDERDQVNESIPTMPDSDPQREQRFRAVAGWFKHFYPGPVKYDATGKMIDPEPATPFPQQPSPVMDPSGRPLDQSLARIGTHMARTAGDLPVPTLVSALQSGLNLIAGDTWSPLKEDGVFGPKTRAALHQTTATHGAGKVEEGLAFGRFTTFAQEAAGRGQADGLKNVTEQAFAPLFPDNGTKAHPAIAEALQHTINDLGSGPVSVDGDIGPETASGFQQTIARVRPEEFTRRFARNSGLL